MISETAFYIITLSERWLKNKKHVLKYFHLPVLEYFHPKETEAKKSDGIWVYVKDCINYNVRNGIFSTDETLNIYRLK